jgi:ribosome-associated toxin RatA of RatAB toxin-antitoxin module
MGAHVPTGEARDRAVRVCTLQLMDFNHYKFVTAWEFDAAADDVFAILEDLASYPQWWREVRRVQHIDDTTAQVLARSFLPYDLAFTTRQRRRDATAGVLEASMTGDLDGFSRWTITAAGADRTKVVFEEDVVARKALLRRLALIARPAFRANHTLMMRNAQRGLGIYLAGYQASRVSQD